MWTLVFTQWCKFFFFFFLTCYKPLYLNIYLSIYLLLQDELDFIQKNKTRTFWNCSNPFILTIFYAATLITKINNQLIDTARGKSNWIRHVSLRWLTFLWSFNLSSLSKAMLNYYLDFADKPSPCLTRDFLIYRVLRISGD